ncbi:squalene synthase HpnC [Roseimaritima sediminicola]|uniref:squalene synthase HpnC n=1 Tax=Roseimaritima sediminicola TaxID=2662066 RepID=UPI001EEEB1BA|nr:squalene synthase HpnC [Roseimaritima sediminicola]
MPRPIAIGFTTATVLSSPPRDALQRRSEAYCRRLARRHYENFLVGTLFLPRRIRQHFFNVYAYCRIADDLADESSSPAAAMAALARWREGMRQCADERTRRERLPHPVFVALRATLRHFSLSSQPFLDLLTAFEQDQSVRRYETFDHLQAYCQNSANPVGRIVLRLAAVDSAETDALSDRVCTGLQLANFCQDVRRDLAIDRVYLPAEDRRRFGVRVEDLQAPRASEPVKRWLRFEVDRAETFLRSGLPLADRVPRWLRRDIGLFVHGGLATLEAIRRADYDVLERRVTVSRWQQLRLVGRAAVGRL